MRLNFWQWLWIAFSILAIIPFVWLSVQFINYVRQPTLIDPNVILLLDAPDKCRPGSLSEAIEKHGTTGQTFDAFEDLTAECTKVEQARAKYPGIRSSKDYRARVAADDAYKARQWPWAISASVIAWFTFIGLVYFAGWTVAWAEATRLSEKRKTQVAETAGLMSSMEAMKIVHRYGKTRLIDDAPGPDDVVDVGWLPASKEQIKKALLWRLAEEPDPETRQHLKAGYLALANYQPGVDDEQARLDRPGSATEARETWRPIVAKESEELIGDLKRLGYWREC